MEALVDAELTSSYGSNATHINMHAFCACRTLVDKLRFQVSALVQLDAARMLGLSLVCRGRRRMSSAMIA